MLQSNRLTDRIKKLQEKTGGGPCDYLELKHQHEILANQEVKQQQKEASQHRTKNLLAQADINPHWRFSSIDPDDPSMSFPLQTATSFVHAFELWEREGGRCVLIYGDYGTGKSTLAGGIAHDLIENHQRSVIFQQWVSITDRLFFGVIEDPKEKNKFRKALETVDLLVIDELAANRSQLPESQANYLGHLLRRRLNLKKSIVLITNHNPESLHYAVGDFCYEAIKGFCPVRVPMHGCSRRPDISIS
jgi:DNA replication protein DnaC